MPPQLETPLAEVAEAYQEAIADPSFMAEYDALLTDYVGRPSPLFKAERLTQELSGATIYLKREDLNHTGAHKINHCLGEGLLAKRMGKKKLLAETGAGQHGVALATAAALLGLECEIHMGAIDIEKQRPNVVRMELLGATIVPVTSGGACLKDAVDSAFDVFNGGSGTGVIVGGSPLGPWEDPNGQMLIGQNNPIQFPEGMWLFDPEVFVDVDGQPYLYFGGNWDFAQDPYHPKSTRVVKLDPNDYTKLEDPSGAGITVIDAPGMFEASSMFERNGTYYYSYSSNFAVGNSQYDDKMIEGQDYPGAGQIAYMMTDDPMDLTREKFAGTLFASHGKWFPGSGGNNHSDVFNYQGKTYFTKGWPPTTFSGSSRGSTACIGDRATSAAAARGSA